MSVLEQLLDRLGLSQYEPDQPGESGSEEERLRDRQTGYQVLLLHPRDVGRLERLATCARQRIPILVSMEQLPKDQHIRLMDYCRGLCGGLLLELQRVTDTVYLITPETVVDGSGESAF